jgi:tellurite resistance protein TerC
VLRATYLAIRRLLVFLVGTSVVLAGVVMIVTPGPAFIVIPAGFALLATEFLWARAVLLRLRRTIEDQVDRARNRRPGNGRGAAPGTTPPRD